MPALLSEISVRNRTLKGEFSFWSEIKGYYHELNFFYISF